RGIRHRREFPRHEAQLDEGPHTLIEQAVIDLVHIGEVVDGSVIGRDRGLAGIARPAVRIVEPDIIVENAVKADRLKPRGLLHGGEVLPVARAQRQDGASGAEGPFPEMRKRRGRGARIDRERLLQRLGARAGRSGVRVALTTGRHRHRGGQGYCQGASERRHGPARRCHEVRPRHAGVGRMENAGMRVRHWRARRMRPEYGRSWSATTASPRMSAPACCASASWGCSTVLNDTLVPRFKALFALSYAQVMLTQFAFFLAYFICSVPAGLLVAR